MDKLATHILIVGGGPAGMAAAAAATTRSEAAITILDENPMLGGQIWRAALGKLTSPEARKLSNAVDKGRVVFINNARAFGHEDHRRLLAETPAGRFEIEFDRLIIATGGRELFLPFPGWTLPGVFGAGGLQALVKGGLSVRGKRVVVAGTGPLLLAVADYLRSQGGIVAAIAEQAPRSRLLKFASGLWRSPKKILEAGRLRLKTGTIRYLTECWVTSAAGRGKLENVKLTRGERNWSVPCDYLACGFHLVSNAELPSLLGCRIENGFVRVDRSQQTSVENIFCAGEPTGIGGVEKALVEGRIAGLAAAGFPEESSALLRRADRARHFVDSLNATFGLRAELRRLADDATIVCRCEDVQYGKLKAFDNWRTAKLQTRCGMGPCQGRVCGAAAEFLFGWTIDPPRPPIFPVKLENL